MIRDNSQIVTEVFMRSTLCYKKRMKIATRCVASSLTVFSMFLIVIASQTISTLDYSLISDIAVSHHYATTFWHGEGIGGYILIGIIAFGLGTAITLICLYLKKKGNGVVKQINSKEDIK